MACFSTATAPERRNPTGKNRVWDFFRLSNGTHPETRRQPAQPRRKIRPTPTKTASGIPYWHSKDPIGENGGVNLYGFICNKPCFTVDVEGRRPLDASDAKTSADYGCKIAKIAMAHYNQNNSYRMPSGAMEGTNFAASNQAGAIIAGLGYELALKEAGANARNRWETLMDAYTEVIESECNKVFYPDPGPDPTPEPTPSPTSMVCEYECPLIEYESSPGSGSDSACVYGNCTFSRQFFGEGRHQCPPNIPGKFYFMELTSEKGCKYCHHSPHQEIRNF